MALVRAKLPEVVVDRRDEEVATLGKQACDSLSAGRKNAAVVSEIREQGLTTPESQTLVALARDVACPT